MCHVECAFRVELTGLIGVTVNTIQGTEAECQKACCDNTACTAFVRAAPQTDTSAAQCALISRVVDRSTGTGSEVAYFIIPDDGKTNIYAIDCLHSFSGGVDRGNNDSHRHLHSPAEQLR